MRDLRLYTYNAGNLGKFGSSKRKINNIQRHFFEDIDQLKHHINWLKGKGFNCQFLIIEYFEKYESQILEII